MEYKSPVSPGGFIPPSVLSPPQSSHASTIAHTSLPHPRASPLKSGGAKESAFIRFVDQGILKLQRRYAIRGSQNIERAAKEEANGYTSFSEAAKDIETLVDLIWVSGTPTLQIPYLLTLASLTAQYLPSFPPSQKPTFRLLGKLDLAFSSLLQGRHVETGEALPGFETGRRVSGTDKVRMKSLVDQTRMTVMDVIGIGGVDDEDEDEDDEETDFDAETDFDVETDYDAETGDDMDVDGGGSQRRGDYGIEDFGEKEMGVARVYDRTVVELGDTIGGSPIGIITDD